MTLVKQELANDLVIAFQDNKKINIPVHTGAHYYLAVFAADRSSLRQVVGGAAAVGAMGGADGEARARRADRGAGYERMMRAMSDARI